MFCITCGAENTPGAKFCIGCGKKCDAAVIQLAEVGLACPNCQYTSPLGKKFCEKCGTSLLNTSPIDARAEAIDKQQQFVTPPTHDHAQSDSQPIRIPISRSAVLVIAATIAIVTIGIGVFSFNRSNVAVALEQLKDSRFDPLFTNNKLLFSFSGFGNLALGDSESSVLQRLQLKKHFNGCSDSPSSEYSFSGDEGKGLIATIEKSKSAIMSEFQITFSKGKLAIISGKGDPRFAMTAGLKVGQSVSKVRDHFNNKDYSYTEKKNGDGPYYEIDVKSKSPSILRIQMLEDTVIGFMVFTPNARIQAHDCGNSYAME